jgi:hypothetical protein
MGSILFWVGVLIVFSIVAPLLKYVIALVAGKQIGAQALAQQPDRIHLQPSGPQAWKDAGAPRAIAGALTSRGFSDAGVFTVSEMPGLALQLLASSRDGFYAAIYQHPQAGVWFDLVSRFEDGTSVTFSTSRPTALKPRPGHTSVNLPGLEPSAVLEKALAQRPRRVIQAVSVEKAVGVFEQSYAESIAYRKQTGISTGEVVGTAARKVA